MIFPFQIARDVPEFRPDFKKVPVPAGIIIGSGRNKILLKTAFFPNCFKLFHKLIQLTKQQFQIMVKK